MKMSREQTRGWRLQNAPFAFQQTYRTPLKNLNEFVHSILAPFDFLEAELRIETWVFTPENFLKHLEEFGIAADSGELSGATIISENRSEGEALLKHALTDWMDFAFLPIKSDFAIYADHDEYTTIFTRTQELTTQLSEAMMRRGFEAKEWTWDGPHSPGIAEECSKNV